MRHMGPFQWMVADVKRMGILCHMDVDGEEPRPDGTETKESMRICSIEMAPSPQGQDGNQKGRNLAGGWEAEPALWDLRWTMHPSLWDWM